MICIDFTTENGVGYLVDVASQRLRIYKNRNQIKTKVQWVPYKELQGSGKIGEPLTVVWDDNNSTVTSNVTELKFTT